MSWYSIREYTERHRLSTSTVRRQIQQGRIYAKKFGRNWYVHYPDSADTGGIPAGGDASIEPQTEPMDFPAPTLGSGSSLQSVVEFSSKALHHYLMLSEKLLAEKDIRIAERERELSERRQAVAELEEYVKLLETELTRLKERPEGWS